MMLLSQPHPIGKIKLMGVPVNFDSLSLDGLLVDWIGALREFSVEAVAILGPDPFGTSEDRQVVAVHPPLVADAAKALAESREFGATWRDSDAPLVAWQHIAKSDHRSDAASLVWSALNIWPLVKRSIAQARSTLSPRERECLVLAFQGLTARESSARLRCTERTVNYHLANAMGKLKVENKLAAIQRACWLGAI